ncbi:hypothetical protein J2728_000458 [Caulobacter segnis]|nr:hypothetical protein [Caulobacter segnis]
MRAIEHPPGGVIAIGRAEATPSLVEMPVDGVLGEAQFAGDFLGAHVPIDQAQALTLTLGETVETLDLVRHRGIALVHGKNFKGPPPFGQASPH